MDDATFQEEADLAYRRVEEINQAAKWCREHYQHHFEFLNHIHDLLVEDERHMARLGLPNAYRYGDVKPQPVLALLTPSQALRLLECYKRAMINTPAAWHARSLAELDRIESDARLASIVAGVVKDAN